MKHKLPIPIQNVVKGMVIEFLYHNELRYVYVLNPRFHDELHGMSMRAIPRTLLMFVIKYVPKLSEKVLYEQHLTKPHIKKVDAYRTFKLDEINSLKVVDYEIPKIL